MSSVTNHDLTTKVHRTQLYPFARGGHADVYRGQYVDDFGRVREVAVKVLRFTQSSERTGFLRESDVWYTANHPNVTTILGVSFDFFQQGTPCLVSPFYRNGDITSYIKKHPRADKLALLAQAASALSYLHNLPIIHGDLTGSNILIDDSGKASVADFGLSRTLQATGFTTLGLETGTMRYMAPELLACMDEEDETNPRATKETDVWAFSMTILEVYTESKPFSNIENIIRVALFVVNGGRPERSRCMQINDELWDMLQKCWNVNPSQRPSMASLAQFFAERATPKDTPYARL